MPKKTKIARLPIPYEARKLSADLKIGGTSVKNNVVSITYMDMATSGTSYIDAILRNDGTYTDLWSGGEIVKFYADFTDGTTQKFEGFLITIEPRIDAYPQIRIYAQDYGIEAQKIKITRIIEADTDIGEIFQILVAENLGHTSTNVTTDTGYTAKPSWKNVSLWQCFKDLAVKYGRNLFDFYCDFSKDWHFTKKGVIKNDSYPITYGNNILRTPRVQDGITDRKNKVIVYGATEERAPVYATSQNKTDQTTLFVMEEKIRNFNLTTYDQCKDEADSILATKLISGKSGEVVITGEIGIKAGEQVFISHPFVPVHGFFSVDSVRHDIGRSYTSTVKFSEALPMSPGVMAIFEQIKTKDEQEPDIENKQGMLDCIKETFENALFGSYSNVEVSNSRLVLTSGQTIGTWISPNLSLDYNATQAYLIINGSDYELSEFYASSNAGASGSWERIYPATLLTLATKSDTARLKIVLKSDSDRPNPSVESVSLGIK